VRSRSRRSRITEPSTSRCRPRRRAIFSAAKPTRTARLEIVFRAAGLDEVWEWYERGTVRTATLLSLQTPAALARIKAAILEGARRFLGPDGLAAPHNAILHVGRKPG
jgi:hypothetical protein